MKKEKLSSEIPKGKTPIGINQQNSQKRQKKPQRLRILIKKWVNKKWIPIYDSCDILPAWRFFKILETNEYRYLLKFQGRKLPEYFGVLLEPIWDALLVEYDQLNGEQIFTNSFKDLASDIQDYNEYIILKCCYNLLLLGDDKALPYLENNFGMVFDEVSSNAITKVRQRVLREETRMKIMQLQKDEQNVINDKVKDQSSFIHSIVQMSNILNRNIDKDKITVSEWVITMSECQKLIKAKKEAVNGGYS